MNQSTEPTLKKRYAFKLGAKGINIPLNLAVNMVAPRLLGSAGFGVYSYLADFFAAVVAFLDCGTSTYFYNRLSQKPDEKNYIWFYGGLVVVIIGACILGVALIHSIGLMPRIWPDTPAFLVWYGVVFGMITWISQVLNKMVDAFGLTVPGEIIRVCHRLALASTLGLFLFLGVEGIDSFFICQILLLVLVSCAWAIVVRRARMTSLPSKRLEWSEVAVMGKETWIYSSPLLVYGAVSLIGLLADRWILQTYFGSTEQGYFGLGVKVASVCFLFTGAMTPLLTREFAKASADQNLEKLRMDFCKFVPSFFLLAAYFGIFAMVNAKLVTQLFGGQEFKDATIPVAIMCLYPIHQTYGQMSGSLFYATGRTRTYRNIGVINVLVGLGMTAFLILPRDIGGLGLGAEGVAIKMVGIQLIGVNIQLWYNSKYLKIKYSKLLIHQLVIIALFITIATVIKYSFEVFVWGEVVKFLLTGILYTIGVIICVVLAPNLIGLSRSELNGILVRLAAYVRHKG